jgi:hypothetical protein
MDADFLAVCVFESGREGTCPGYRESDYYSDGIELMRLIRDRDFGWTLLDICGLLLHVDS